MGKFEVNQIDVNGNGRVILYQRPRKDGSLIPTWQMRISIPNSTGYHRSSTGEKEEPEARRKAINTYEELYMKVLSGGHLKSKTFRECFVEWKKDFPEENSDKEESYIAERIRRVGNFPQEFFGNMKMDEITRRHFVEFWIWRRKNAFKFNPSTKVKIAYEPSNSTLRNEASCLRIFFRYTVDKGWLQTVPEIKSPSMSKNRRPSFTLKEWRLLVRRMREWVKEGEVWGAVGRDRFLTQQYVLILANCGARIGEIRNLKWNDLSTIDMDEGKRLVANVRGKTGSRELVFQEGSEEYVKRLYDLRKRELNDEPPSDGFVICHKDGKSIGSLKKGFNSLLEYCDLVNDSKGDKRTLYSLRHFYATQRLGEEVNPYLLATQMGTSISMLERFYGHIVTRLVAKEITKTKGTKTTPKVGINEYPFEVAQ